MAVTVTPLGKWAMAAEALSLLLGIVFGWHEWLAVTVLLGLLLAAAAITTRQPIAYEAHIAASHEHARIGDRLELHIEIRNTGPSRSVAATAQVLIAHEQHSFTVPPIRPQQSASITVALTAVARAVVPVGPLIIRHSDLCGFIQREQSYSNHIHIIIHPQTVRLPALHAGFLHSLDSVNQQHAMNDGFEFHALRPYQPGDDLRYIHWPSSAKSGVLMFKQYVDATYPVTALTINTQWNSYANPQEFELAVSAYTSLALQCLDEHHMLFCNDSNGWSRPGCTTQLLFQCARITASDTNSTPFAEYFTNTAPLAALHIFIVGSAISIDSLAHVIHTYKAFESSIAQNFVIIRIKLEAPPNRQTSNDYTIVDVGSLHDLAQSLIQWDKAT